MIVWLWSVAFPAILLAFLALVRELRRASWVRARLAQPPPAKLPPASIIVPVKGDCANLRANLASLAAQDYPNCDLTVTARTATDIPPGVLPSGIQVVVGRPDDPATGEKIQNLLAGIKAAGKSAGVVLAFADADGAVGPHWLRALVAPIAEPGVAASTGYRWHAPEPAGLGGLVLSIWDSAVLSRLGAGNNRFAWGGATAVVKETFFDLRIQEAWKGAVSDDYCLSAAVHRAGRSIAFAPGAMAVSVEPGFWGFAWRQLLFTRIHDPGLWWMALAAHLVYCAAMAAGVAALALGHWQGAAALALQLVPGMLQGLLRARVAREAMPELRPWFRRHLWAHAALVPLVTWVWLATLLISSVGSEIIWAGRRYRL